MTTFFEFVLTHPDKGWDWEGVSRNPNITMEDIISHPENPWNWWWISLNPNLTMEFINSHPEKPWDWGNVSFNTFGWSNDSPLHYWRSRKSNTIKNTRIIKEELVAKACHPMRKNVFDWICDIEERNDMLETL